MRKLVFATVAAVALLSAPAFSADMAVKAPPMTAAPVSSWTGFYGGINGGYGWDPSTGDNRCFTPAGIPFGGGCDLPITGMVKPRGWIFGGQVGYNLQVNSIVYGLETDIQWSGIKGSGSAIDSQGGTYNLNANLNWFGTARGRIGVLANPNMLLYATGGLIYGRESASSLLSRAGFPISYPASTAGVREGWTLGGGLEYAFTATLSGKIEGLYYDMGSVTALFANPATGFTIGARFADTGAIVRAGLNWKLPIATK
jgi:outer membrane immunogenic protein